MAGCHRSILRHLIPMPLQHRAIHMLDYLIEEALEVRVSGGKSRFGGGAEIRHRASANKL